MGKKRGGGGHGGGGAHDSGGGGRWLLTYADMITLLVAFFIMMYSMSVLNLAKFRQVAVSIRSGFGGEMKDGGGSVLPNSMGGGSSVSILPEMSSLPAHKIAEEMRRFAKEKHLENDIRLKETPQGLVVSMVTDKLLFAKGQSDMSPQAKEVLDELIKLIIRSNYSVRVEGHTDNVPINTPRFPSNWELSTTRATTVVRYLIEHGGIQPGRLSASGYADVRPLVPNDTEAHRMYNRRVDLVVLHDGQRSPEVRGSP